MTFKMDGWSGEVEFKGTFGKVVYNNGELLISGFSSVTAAQFMEQAADPLKTFQTGPPKDRDPEVPSVTVKVDAKEAVKDIEKAVEKVQSATNMDSEPTKEEVPNPDTSFPPEETSPPGEAAAPAENGAAEDTSPEVADVLKQCKRFSEILETFIEAGITEEPDLVKACEDYKELVPMLKRGGDLPKRVERTLAGIR
jgi:hypothetical protein